MLYLYGNLRWESHEREPVSPHCVLPIKVHRGGVSLVWFGEWIQTSVRPEDLPELSLATTRTWFSALNKHQPSIRVN